MKTNKKTWCINGLLENKVWQEENKFVYTCMYV